MMSFSLPLFARISLPNVLSKLRPLAVASALLSVIAFSFPSCKGDEETAEASGEFVAMGTVISITAYAATAEKAESAVASAQAEILRLEKLWSTTDPESEISALNSTSDFVTVSDETASLLSFAKRISTETGGAFNPTVYPLVNAWGFLTHNYRIPPEEEIADLLSRVGIYKVFLAENAAMLWGDAQLDLGGIAKGAAGDAIAALLRGQGVNSALINLGGNVHTVGARTDGEPWRIGVLDPSGAGILGLVAVEDSVVITSGNYERNFIGEDGRLYHHIIDPATGWPAESGLVSVTIVAKEGMLADALSTALYVMGAEKAIGFWRERGREDGGFETILVTSEGAVMVSEGLVGIFEPELAFIDNTRVITEEPGVYPLWQAFVASRASAASSQ